MRTICAALLTVVLAVTMGVGGAFAVDEANKTREAWKLVSVTANVQAIDHAKRNITLKGPRGNEMTFTVDKRVKRLNEIKKGDQVNVDYYVSLATEIREPTAEEKENPLVAVEAKAKAPMSTTPGAGGVRTIRAVVAVQEIDRKAERVTVRGPLGNALTVHVAEPKRLEGLHLGDTIVVTYTEAMAISVEKVK